MDDRTVQIYEERAAEWARRKVPGPMDAAARFGSRVHGWRVDLGCGPGWHLPALGEPAVALDAARAMLDLVPEYAPGAGRVEADVEALPFRRGALAGAWASKCYQHLDARRLPLALADLHAALALGGRLHLLVTSAGHTPAHDDRFGGRFFAAWTPELLARVVEGAGFTVDTLAEDGEEWLAVDATRARTLPDTVGPDMRLLVVGLNPSVYSADRGVGFARPGNRFWPAALAAGIVTRDRDTRHAFLAHGIGFTDLVKRATARADELTRDEYRAGAARVAALVEWLQPAAVCFAGLSGYRDAVDRRATVGWQPEPFGGRPAYVMPNPSGINAHATPADLTAHLRAAATPPASGP